MSIMKRVPDLEGVDCVSTPFGNLLRDLRRSKSELVDTVMELDALVEVHLCT